MTTSNYKLPQWKNGDEFHVIAQTQATRAISDAALTTAQGAVNE